MNTDQINNGPDYQFTTIGSHPIFPNTLFTGVHSAGQNGLVIYENGQESLSPSNSDKITHLEFCEVMGQPIVVGISDKFELRIWNKDDGFKLLYE